MIIKCLKGNVCLLCLLLPMVIFLILMEMPNGFVLFCLGRKNCLWRKGKRVMMLILLSYPVNSGFCLAWLLAFTKSFTWLVYHASGSIKQTNYATDKVHERLCKH